MNSKLGQAYCHTETQESQLVEAIVNAAKEVKGRDIVILETADNSCLADYTVVISGRSDRQVQGIANRIIDAVDGLINESPIGVEGLDEGKWALIDFSSVIIHIFYEETRNHFGIEGLWSDARKFQVGDDLAEPFRFQVQRAA